MLKILGVDRACGKLEASDVIIAGPVVHYLEVEDEGGNPYEIVINESTYHVVKDLIITIQENQSHLKEA